LHPAAKFHHLVFNRLDVITLIYRQTNKQTDAVKNIHLTSICYASG